MLTSHENKPNPQPQKLIQWIVTIAVIFAGITLRNHWQKRRESRDMANAITKMYGYCKDHPQEKDCEMFTRMRSSDGQLDRMTVNALEGATKGPASTK